jgi:hypothetical protein
MLRAHDVPDRLLDQPAAGHLAEEDDPSGLDFLGPSAKPGSLGRLGHYEVLEVIGRGGMGVVLRAFDDKLHRVVAVKVLAPALAGNASARQRFVREARAAAAVTHDNVIDIHAVEDDGPVPYLVMQCVVGRTLQEKLDATGPLELRTILRIGLQMAEGLAAAHRQGLIHRDIKPANILLENGVERVQITDFGLARAVDDASLTQSGYIAGTPMYMSPEQARGEALDPRTDLFSLGSVLYALCSGHPPFRAENTMAVLRRVCDDEPRRLREASPDVPEWLEAIISRLHRKAPADRFATAQEVADQLSRCLAQLQTGGVVRQDPAPTWPSGRAGAAAPPPATGDEVPGQRQPATRRVRVRLVAAALAAAALATAGLALLWYLTRPQDQPTRSDGSPSGAQHREPPSLLLNGLDHRVELANTAGMIDLNGAFTVEMWVKFGKGVQYFAGDETWPDGFAKVDRPYGWVLRIAEDDRMNFTAATVPGRPEGEWAVERAKDPIVIDDDWHHLAVSKSREVIHVFLDGKPYLHMKTSNIKFMNSPFNLFLGATNLNHFRRVNCRFKAFRVSGKQLYSQPFTPPAEFTRTDDTLLLLDFSAGKGDTLPDVSGHGHHGTIRGGSWSSSEPAKQ